jgi:hypothetical protein
MAKMPISAMVRIRHPWTPQHLDQLVSNVIDCKGVPIHGEKRYLDSIPIEYMIPLVAFHEKNLTTSDRLFL